MSFSHSPVISLNLERGDANFGWFKKKLDDDLSEKGRKKYIGKKFRPKELYIRQSKVKKMQKLMPSLKHFQY